MRASIFAGTLAHQKAHVEPMAEGFRRHGVEVEVFTGEPTGDVIVVWGWRLGRRHLGGRPVLVMERGYVGDRFAWTSLGFDGLNGRARFPKAQDNGDRWMRLHGDRMRPWRRSGGYVLIMGQVAGDMSLAHVGGNLARWYEAQAAIYGDEARFRPHPDAARRGGAAGPRGVPVIRGDLQAALDGARLVVTFNSNSGVDAVLAGVPTIATDEGSMAWTVSARAEPAEAPNRGAWAADLAWAQWREDEIRMGDAWAALAAIA